MRFSCRPVGLGFIEQAPWAFRNVVDLDASPEAVFDLFTDGESWPRWFDGIRHVEWTSPEPRGVGTTRTVTLATATVFETFLAWERGNRFAFRFDGATRPLFRAGLEDYRLEPLPGGRCRLQYDVLLEPSLVVRLLAPVTRQVFARMFRRAAGGLQEHLRGLRVPA